MNIKRKKFNKNKISIKRVSVYVIFGVLWISLSDRLLNYLINDKNTLNMFQTFKGIIFVIITSILLYSTIISVVNSLVKTHNNLVVSEEFYSSLFNNNHLPFIIVDP